MSTTPLVASASRRPLPSVSPPVVHPYEEIEPLGAAARIRASLLGVLAAISLLALVSVAGLLVTVATFGYSVGELL